MAAVKVAQFACLAYGTVVVGAGLVVTSRWLLDRADDAVGRWKARRAARRVLSGDDTWREFRKAGRLLAGFRGGAR